MIATRLTCEFRHEPLGIDEARPFLGWVVESAARAARQTAYRILVASSPELLATETGDLWDSGRNASDRASMIRYSGRPLRAQQACFWKVMLWDERGDSTAWSEGASWTMGILEVLNWKASWIGYDAPRRSTTADSSWRLPEKGELFLPPPRYLKKIFTVLRPVRRALTEVTALGLCDLYLDNRRVSDDRFTPGWTDYDRRVYYRTYDVTGLLSPGVHALGAILADGWYSGYVGFGGHRDLYGTKTRLAVQLLIEYDDGSADTIVSGPDWRATTGPLLEADFLMGEKEDARRGGSGILGTSDAGLSWDLVDMGAEVHPILEAHPAPPVRAFATLTPKRITEVSSGVWIFDLGQNFAGVARLSVTGAPGQKIVLRYGERLNPDGTLYTENLRTARSTDVYICRGGLREVWEPRFTFHGFQYVEVSGLNEPPTPETITGIALSSETPRAGSFECSSEMVNRLYSNILWTQRANFIDIPTDCPQRDERLGWTGDAQIYIRSACLNSDVHAFFRKWLLDLTDAQREDGEFPMVAPLKVAGDDGGPGWADAGVICPWTIYDVYGDRDILEKNYPAMVKFVEFCKDRSTPEALPPEKFHCFGDWLNVHAETPKEVIATAYFAHSTAILARTAEALGKDMEAADYRRLFEKIKRGFNSAYVDAQGRIKGESQTAYVLALAFGLLDQEHAILAAQHLIADIESRGGHLSTGFLGTKDLMLVCAAIGRNDVAYRLLLNETYPSWGFEICNGATSIWERWDGWTPERGFQDPEMNSFSHYAFGAVWQWMVENIGGIKNEEPGYRRVLVAPQPGGDLTWARTTYESVAGTIGSSWKREAGRMTVQISIPANCAATIVLPGVGGEVLESGGPAENQSSLRAIRKGVFQAGSGQYEFSYPWEE